MFQESIRSIQPGKIIRNREAFLRRVLWVSVSRSMTAYLAERSMQPGPVDTLDRIAWDRMPEDERNSGLNVIKTLPKHTRRTAFSLAYTHATSAEIGEYFGMSVSTVNRHIKEIKKVLINRKKDAGKGKSVRRILPLS